MTTNPCAMRVAVQSHGKPIHGVECTAPPLHWRSKSISLSLFSVDVWRALRRMTDGLRCSVNQCIVKHLCMRNVKNSFSLSLSLWLSLRARLFTLRRFSLFLPSRPLLLLRRGMSLLTVFVQFSNGIASLVDENSFFIYLSLSTSSVGYLDACVHLNRLSLSHPPSPVDLYFSSFV